MKVIIVCCLLAVALGEPQNYYQGQYRQPYTNQYQQSYNPQSVVPIVSESNEINPDGSFRYSYQTGDGQQAEAQGYLKNAGIPDAEAETIQGSYSYTAPDGTPINVRYIADENGFRAEGAHLPTPPPIPAAIERALEYIKRTQGNQPQYQDQYQNQFQNQYQNQFQNQNQGQYRPVQPQYRPKPFGPF